MFNCVPQHSFNHSTFITWTHFTPMKYIQYIWIFHKSHVNLDSASSEFNDGLTHFVCFLRWNVDQYFFLKQNLIFTRDKWHPKGGFTLLNCISETQFIWWGVVKFAFAWHIVNWVVPNAFLLNDVTPKWPIHITFLIITDTVCV